MCAAVTQTSIAGYPVRRGKVRDIYDLGDRLLLVSTDRISAFDWVLPTPIPDKGRVLTQISRLLVRPAGHAAPPVDHRRGRDRPARPAPTARAWPAGAWWSASAQVVPIECVVRGYLDGSGWKEYQQSGTVCGIRCRPGCSSAPSCPSRSSRRPPRRRPGTTSTSRSSGWWRSWARRRPRNCGGGASRSIAAAPSMPASRASSSPTPSSSGAACDGELILIDEVLTPDSSRFWPADQYEPGRSQPSFRQAVRPRLADVDRLGQEQPAAGAARRGRRQDAARSTSRPTSA